MKGEELGLASLVVPGFVLCVNPWEACPSLNGDGGRVDGERKDRKGGEEGELVGM